MIEIQFIVHKLVNYGQAVFVSGNLSNFGQWNPQKAFRLNWSSGHKWSGTLTISKKELVTNRFLEYKYFIGKWEGPLHDQIQWQKGLPNRKVESNMLQNKETIGKFKIIEDDQWNTRKIKMHLVTKKHINPDQSTDFRYSIIGNCPQLGRFIANLGNWKIRKVLKIQQNIDMKTIKKLSEKINRKDLTSFLKNQLIFQVFTTTLFLPLDQQKFSYYFIRENQKLEIQRHPGRCYTIQDPHNYPHRFAVIYSCENIAIYDQQNFDKPTFSKITTKIYLGSYLKNENDLKHLKNLGIQAIYSIQTQEDYQDHGISTFYLQLLCRQYDILFRTIEIQDRNSRDFVEKSMKAVAQIDNLIKSGNTTYVYCTAGKYRSPQMVALYLTLKNGINVAEAVKLIKQKHPVARPNQRTIKNAVYHINKFKTNFSDSRFTVESIKN